MRDPNRIGRMVQQLEKAWDTFPDMRLGQLLINITRVESTSDLWNLEDAQIEHLLNDFIRLKVDAQGLRYVKRRWTELRGDQYDDFGHSWWYFEIDPFCNVIRQIEHYDNGSVFGYSSAKLADEFGTLTDQPLESTLQDFEIIRAVEFNEMFRRRTNK